jgi:predicted nucleotidyltransferase
VRRYSAADRASLQRTLIEEFARDDRVDGVLLVGSGVHGFADEYSDLDLAVVLGADEPAAFAREWGARLEADLPVVHRFGDDRGDAGYVVGLLLDNFLEVDIGFVAKDQMADRGMPWAVAFDRSGDVGRRQRALQPRPEDRAAAYRRNVDGIWHWIMRCRVAIARGRLLLALTDLDEIRMRTLRVAAIRGGIDHRKFFDDLPRDVHARVAESLPRALDAHELSRALTASAHAFFTEAKALEAELGLDIASRLEPVLTAYLEQFGRVGECASR